MQASCALNWDFPEIFGSVLNKYTDSWKIFSKILENLTEPPFTFSNSHSRM